MVFLKAALWVAERVASSVDLMDTMKVEKMAAE